MARDVDMVLRALAALTLAAASLAGAPAARAAEGRARLAVAAAANLKGPAEQLERAFEAERPGLDVVLTLGASGALFAQIRSGAPFDLFLSADREYPARLVEAGLAADERVYAFGRLVAWLPPGSTVDLERRGLAALTDPAVRRIAIANPALAPFGRATEAALRAAGVYEAVKAKLALGTSAGQAAQFATTGAADVAFLPASLAREPALAAGRAVPVPEGLHPRIEQSGVVLSSARDREAARAFLAFLGGEKARAILAKYGYGLP
jgi:molybdate transport system substrate-binding protein